MGGEHFSVLCRLSFNEVPCSQGAGRGAPRSEMVRGCAKQLSHAPPVSHSGGAWVFLHTSLVRKPHVSPEGAASELPGWR